MSVLKSGEVMSIRAEEKSMKSFLGLCCEVRNFYGHYLHKKSGGTFIDENWYSEYKKNIDSQVTAFMAWQGIKNVAVNEIYDYLFKWGGNLGGGQACIDLKHIHCDAISNELHNQLVDKFVGSKYKNYKLKECEAVNDLGLGRVYNATLDGRPSVCKLEFLVPPGSNQRLCSNCRSNPSIQRHFYRPYIKTKSNDLLEDIMHEISLHAYNLFGDGLNRRQVNSIIRKEWPNPKEITILPESYERRIRRVISDVYEKMKHRNLLPQKGT